MAFGINNYKIIINTIMISYIFRKKSGVLEIVRKFNKDNFLKQTENDNKILVVTEDDVKQISSPLTEEVAQLTKNMNL